jgi:hypothetical protein
MKRKAKLTYEDPIVTTMKKHNIPVTRENYLKIVHDGESEWGAEHEAEIMPPELQDWSKVGK